MFIDALSRLIFPVRCILCGKISPGEQPVCFECSKKITLCSRQSICKKCSRPVPLGAKLCGTCLTRPRSFTACYCAAVYQGELRQSVIRYKFYHHPEYHRGYAHLIFDYLSGFPALPQFDVAICAPLSKKRMQERGYNQAELIARAVARKLRVPFVNNCVHKVRHTPAQSTLSYQERQKNLSGAFSVDKPEKIAGKTVLLVDDVFTTGATADEISKALLRAGAKEVYVAALAVTPHE